MWTGDQERGARGWPAGRRSRPHRGLDPHTAQREARERQQVTNPLPSTLPYTGLYRERGGGVQSARGGGGWPAGRRSRPNRGRHPSTSRCRADMAHIRQSRSDSASRSASRSYRRVRCRANTSIRQSRPDPWLSGRSPLNFVSNCLIARKRFFEVISCWPAGRRPHSNRGLIPERSTSRVIDPS